MAPDSRITETDDPRLADYRDLTDVAHRVRHEEAERVFIVEGALAVAALTASAHVGATRSVLVDERRRDRLDPIVSALAAAGAVVLVAPPGVLRATVGFDLHRGMVAAVDRPPATDPGDLIARSRRLLVVEGVNDHENLGGLFRNAAAFGADGVLLDPTCADAWYRRCVRVSLGHVLRVPHARAETWPGPLAALPARSWRICALATGGPVELHDVAPADVGERIAVVVGAEGSGLARSTLDALADTARVRIAMADGVDSLNVATAAAVALAHLVPPEVR